MRYRTLTKVYDAPCPIVDCTEVIEVHLDYRATDSGLDIDVTYPMLDLHLVEHGMAPLEDEDERA